MDRWLILGERARKKRNTLTIVNYGGDINFRHTVYVHCHLTFTVDF